MAVAVAVVVEMNVNRRGDGHHKRGDHKWTKHHTDQDHKRADRDQHDHKGTDHDHKHNH